MGEAQNGRITVANTEADQSAGWGDIKLIASAQQPVPSAARSPSGDALSMSFDNFLVDLQGPDAALVGQASIAFEVPFALPRGRGLHGVFADVAYSVDKTPGARGVLFMCVGNADKTIQFAYEQRTKIDGDPGSPIQALNKDSGESLFSIERWPDVESVPQPRPPLVVSIIVVGQRQTAAESLRIQVSSLDLKAIPFGAVKVGEEIQV
jgi:hypothetical protein